jgi:hypothetical protein
VGPRAGLEAVEKKKNIALPGIEPGRPARSYTDLLIYDLK